jgi:ADP-heptose:LPS heptosyltransferase
MAEKYSEVALVFFGSEDEFYRSDRVAAVWPGRTLNLCGKLSPRESAAVMRRAALFIGHDSGPMHLASAVGTSCVVMFGDHNPPRKWHPFGKHHRLIHNMQGVLRISPEEVYTAMCSVICARGALDHGSVSWLSGRGVSTA